MKKRTEPSLYALVMEAAYSNKRVLAIEYLEATNKKEADEKAERLVLAFENCHKKALNETVGGKGVSYDVSQVKIGQSTNLMFEN